MSDRVLARWSASASAEAESSPYGYASHHLDDLGIVPAHFTSLRDAIRVVELATRAIERYADVATVRLAVPAGWAGGMVTELPSLEPWSLMEREPPSLYFMQFRHFGWHADRESYRCPYELEQLERAGVAAEYDCGRALEDRVWDPPEWTRTVWFFKKRLVAE